MFIVIQVTRGVPNTFQTSIRASHSQPSHSHEPPQADAQTASTSIESTGYQGKPLLPTSLI